MRGARSILSNSAFGLVVCAIMLLSIEGVARLLPLPESMTRARPIAPPDRGSALLERNGYRGRRPCKDCPDSLVRIVTTGGSSTFGIPMAYGGKTYSAVLQRLLDERRPLERYEVLNGGIPGFGIWQIAESLERVYAADRPDILVVCAWFNDSSIGNGWYGMQGLSDREAYDEVRRLRGIEDSALYRVLAASRAYSIFRAAASPLVSMARASAPEQRKRRRRTSPEEFELGLERVADLADKHGILPIFMFEPLNRTLSRAEEIEKNRYYQAIERVAAERGIPVVDTLTPFAEREGEWLFYDFIHPNEHGHEVIAEALFRSLFSKDRHTRRSAKAFRELGIELP